MVSQDAAPQQKDSCFSIGVFVQLPRPRTIDSKTQGIGAGNVQESNILLGLNQSFVDCRPPSSARSIAKGR
jgi:hypothetical protein